MLKISTVETSNESFVMFPKFLFHEHGYEGSELDISLLAITKSLANNFTGTAITSINDLMSIMNINHKNRAASQKVRESIIRLQAMNYITVYVDGNKTNTVTKLRLAQTYFIKPNKETEVSFVKVYETELDKFLNNLSKNESKLYKIYMAIVFSRYFLKTKVLQKKSITFTDDTNKWIWLQEIIG